MFKKIDLWIGKRMSTRRWIAVWMLVETAGLLLLFTVKSWFVWTLCPMIILLSAVMALVNLRRLMDVDDQLAELRREWEKLGQVCIKEFHLYWLSEKIYSVLYWPVEKLRKHSAGSQKGMR